MKIVKEENRLTKQELEELLLKDDLAKKYKNIKDEVKKTNIENKSLNKRIDDLELEASKAFRLQKELQKTKAEKNEIESSIDLLNNPLSISAAKDWVLAKELQGGSVYAQDMDNTYLGVIDFNGTHPDSIFNEVGLHGSNVGLDSIWSDVGFFGSSVSLYSARNDLSIEPPMIVINKRIVGHITTNNLLASPLAIDPYKLRSIARTIQGF